MSGAKDRARRLIEAGAELIETGEVPSTVHFLAAHGINRAVDREIRQLPDQPNVWKQLSVTDAVTLADLHRGVVVLFGAHPNGYVREAAVEIAHSFLDTPGVVSMLAQRCVDPVPPIRDHAQGALRDLFAHEVATGEVGSPMSPILTRATRGIVSSAETVEYCPDLVLAALDLFENRVGRFRRDRGRDHHVRNLRDVDRRSQLLDHLRRTDPADLSTERQQALAALIEFYEHSLANTPRAN